MWSLLVHLYVIVGSSYTLNIKALTTMPTCLYLFIHGYVMWSFHSFIFVIIWNQIWNSALIASIKHNGWMHYSSSFFAFLFSCIFYFMYYFFSQEPCSSVTLSGLFYEEKRVQISPPPLVVIIELEKYKIKIFAYDFFHGRVSFL